MDWDECYWHEITPLLRAPLDPGKVKPPPPGKYGEYVEGYHVIQEANRIFGHGGWSYCITDLREVSRQETTDRNGNPQIRMGYLCRVLATVGGTTREGAAVGSGIAKPENEADAHESAVKEAETDALKRALRSYGYTFGLALYEKPVHGQREHVKAPEPPAAERRDHLMKLIAGKTDQEALARLYNAPKFKAALSALPEPMQAEIGAAISKREADIAGAADAIREMGA